MDKTAIERSLLVGITIVSLLDQELQKRCIFMNLALLGPLWKSVVIHSDALLYSCYCEVKMH